MFVENWMTPNPLTVPPAMTISAAALLMGRHKFRHLLVAEATRKGKILVGLLSKYDLARAFPSHLNPFSLEVAETTVPQPISTIMVRNVVTVDLIRRSRRRRAFFAHGASTRCRSFERAA